MIVLALAASPSLAFGLFFAAAVFPGGPFARFAHLAAPRQVQARVTQGRA